MITLKTYTISTYITSGQVDIGALDFQLETASVINGFDGVTIDGDILSVHGTSFSDESTCDTLVQDHDGLPLPATIPVSALIRSFFASFLLLHADKNWTQADIDTGLTSNIYPDSASIPDPANASIPGFAIIDATTHYELAYWDYESGASGSWSATVAPWNYPFLEQGPVIKLDPANGAGNSTWNYAMGTEFHIKNPGTIQGMHVKWGTGAAGNDHRWEIRKSTVTGSTAPALSTYTNIVASGTITYTSANTWESVGSITPITTAIDEWYIAYAFAGTSSGQSHNIATLRSGEQLVEDFAEVNAGIYTSDPTGFPGANPLPTPTTRQTALIYGVATLDMGE